MLPEEAIQKMYSLMLGKSDKSTEVNGEYSLWWTASVLYLFDEYGWPMP